MHKREKKSYICVITVSFGGNALDYRPEIRGIYSVTFGNYSVPIKYFHVRIREQYVKFGE